MKKQVIVTGGAGFIGHHLVKKLIINNYYPIIIDNFFNADSNNIKTLPQNKYTLIKCDINDSNLLNELQKFSAKILIHLAAIHFIPYCINHPQKTIETNVFGTQNVLKISENLRIKKFIFSSSAAIYKPNDIAHKESDPLSPIDTYGKSKLKAEELIKDFCNKKRIEYYILRLFNVYGKNNLTSHFIPSVTERFKKSDRIKVGNIETVRDYIYVEDVVNVILKIIKKNSLNINHVYNIGTGKGHSGKEILSLLEKIFKTKVKITKDKKLARKADRKFLLANMDKICKSYKWQPNISLEEGLKKIIENE
ncbi:MAG: NAD-dependent epimerase/dehydratase family protein [Candidatus Paceibacterota bacterium]|jgi:UDP-glucose 4-epimerase